MTNKPDITWLADLQPLPQSRGGCEQLRLALGQLRTHEDLLRILGRYVHFNAPFGAGVAHLASQVAVRQDLFGDETESVPMISDRSYDIAAQIFAAAVEEFCGSSPEHNQSHRRLAQDALRAAGKHFGYKGAALSKIVEPNRETDMAMQRAKSGYGIGQNMDEETLLQGIGFHIGSEQLAGEEFRIFDTFLREEHADLVRYMESVDPEVSNVQTYIWFKLHTTVEDEHADHAFQAANLALRYYRGHQDVGAVKERIIDGFINFADVQTNFLTHIGAD